MRLSLSIKNSIHTNITNSKIEPVFLIYL